MMGTRRSFSNLSCPRDVVVGALPQFLRGEGSLLGVLILELAQLLKTNERFGMLFKRLIFSCLDDPFQPRAGTSHETVEKRC